MEMMSDCHEPDYEMYQLFCDPSHTGHSACSRSRTYVIGCHQERSVLLHDPWELQDLISRKVVKHACTYPSDYLVSTQMEVELEAQEKARVRGVPYQPGMADVSYLLTKREKKALADYELEYWRRTGCSAVTDEDMFVFLGDDPTYSLTWSFNGRLPTYRMNSRSALLWSCKCKRWLTGKERLCSLGWPVLQPVASAMSCPMIPALDVKRASDLAGNSMHMLNTGVMQLLALCCVGPSESGSWSRDFLSL